MVVTKAVMVVVAAAEAEEVVDTAVDLVSAAVTEVLNN